MRTSKLSRFLFLILPLALFFSFHPVISIAENSSMNFELSIPEIWLFVFFFASLPLIPKLIRFFGWKKLLISALIPLYLTLSIIWSGNRIRALLTAGIFWLIAFAGLNLIYQLKTDQNQRFKKRLLKSLLISAAIVSVFCWLQCILDLAGVSRDYTLLCLGCTSASFGFPHPNGFAIEPQFMGNLLIAPTLLALYFVSAPAYKNHKRRPILIALTLFLTTTIFITFSRGAIYAFIVGFIIEQILLRHRNAKSKQAKLQNVKAQSLKSQDAKKCQTLKASVIVVSAFLISLCAQGIFAAVSPTSDTFISGVTKSIHQLTLGKVDLRPSSDTTDSPASTGMTDVDGRPISDTTDSPTSAVTTRTGDEPRDDVREERFGESVVSLISSPDSHFSGYVAESTDIRLNLNTVAIKTWASSPKYILIGAGLGSAGTAIHNYLPEEIGPKEIVQNEYVSLLLELGLAGVGIIIFVIVYAIRALIIEKSKIKKSNKTTQESSLTPLFVAVIIAFALTLLFFSGLPNALHIYLFPLLFIS